MTDGINRWNEDTGLVKIKFFRSSDEPSHRALTEDEVHQIQQQVEDTKALAANLSSEDIKHKESQMEGRSMKMVNRMDYLDF